MLTKDEPDEPEIFAETYSTIDVGIDKRCRGDNPVIGRIERALGKACEFTRPAINPRELSKEDNFFYKRCFAKMFSNRLLIISSLLTSIFTCVVPKIIITLKNPNREIGQKPY